MSNQIYDAYWQSGKHVTREWRPEFFEESLGILKGKECVLDYGCGFGYSYQRLLSRNIQKYIGADVSEKAVHDAQKKGLKAVIITDSGQTEIPNASCDGAVCSEVFEHLWDPLAAAKELNRILKDNGILVATVPNFGYFSWRLLALLRAQVPLEPETAQNRYKGVHIRFFSKLMLKRLLSDAGFKSIKIYSWCGGSIWHVSRTIGPLGRPFDWADQHLPAMLRFSILARAWPNVFSERLRAVAVK